MTREYVLLEDGNIGIKDIIEVIDVNKLKEEREILEVEYDNVVAALSEIDQKINGYMSLLDKKQEITVAENVEQQPLEVTMEELKQDVEVPLPDAPEPVAEAPAPAEPASKRKQRRNRNRPRIR